MKKRPDPRRSIYTELAVLLLIAAAIASLFFAAMYFGINSMLEFYTDRSGYTEKQRAASAIYLQEYVDENVISTENINDLENFRRKKQVLMIQVVDDGQLIYDSELIGEDLSNIRLNLTTESENCFPLRLADKDVIVSIDGSFGYERSTRVLFLAVIMTVIVFIVAFLAGFRAKIEYIKKLHEEIALLEGGMLDYSITIEGQDELAALAVGLDDMRISFKRQLDEIEKLSLTNQKMITEISHDLRTPLTAVLLYAEILQNSKNLTDAQKMEYINKIIKKIEHMKDLSDHLLTYSASSSAGPTVHVESMSAKAVFYDELSDFSGYLTEQGFEVVGEAAWSDAEININSEFISRIFNNISSNILKYADRAHPVIIRCGENDRHFCLSFMNVPAAVEKQDSRGIGVGSIQSMMQQLGGSCEVNSRPEEYELILSFAEN